MAAHTHSHRHRRSNGVMYSHSHSHVHGAISHGVRHSAAGRARAKAPATSTVAKLRRAANRRRRDSYGRFK